MELCSVSLHLTNKNVPAMRGKKRFTVLSPKQSMQPPLPDPPSPFPLPQCSIKARKRPFKNPAVPKQLSLGACKEATGANQSLPAVLLLHSCSEGLQGKAFSWVQPHGNPRAGWDQVPSPHTPVFPLCHPQLHKEFLATPFLICLPVLELQVAGRAG